MQDNWMFQGTSWTQKMKGLEANDNGNYRSVCRRRLTSTDEEAVFQTRPSALGRSVDRMTIILEWLTDHRPPYACRASRRGASRGGASGVRGKMTRGWSRGISREEYHERSQRGTSRQGRSRWERSRWGKSRWGKSRAESIKEVHSFAWNRRTRRAGALLSFHHGVTPDEKSMVRQPGFGGRAPVAADESAGGAIQRVDFSLNISFAGIPHSTSSSALKSEEIDTSVVLFR